MCIKNAPGIENGKCTCLYLSAEELEMIVWLGLEVQVKNLMVKVNFHCFCY